MAYLRFFVERNVHSIPTKTGHITIATYLHIKSNHFQSNWSCDQRNLPATWPYYKLLIECNVLSFGRYFRCLVIVIAIAVYEIC